MNIERIFVGGVALYFAYAFIACASKMFELWNIEAYTFMVCCIIMGTISMALWLVGIAYKNFKKIRRN